MHGLTIAGEAAPDVGTMARRQRLVRIVFVDREQATLAVTLHEDHPAARAFAAPAVAFERGQAVSECAAKIGAGWQFRGVEHVVEEVA